MTANNVTVTGPRRAGLSLLELMVVIAILGVLLGMLLPGIQRVVNAVSNHQSKNNLRQIGMAAVGYAADHGGKMPYHIGDGDMTQKTQSAMYALLSYCDSEKLFQAPTDRGSVESPAPMWESFGSSYKLEGRAFSHPGLPDRTVQEYDKKTGKLVNKVKKAEPALIRTMQQHMQGIDIKKVLAGKPLKPEDMVSASQIQLARDWQEPWKQGETKYNPLRGIYTVLPYQTTHMNVVFVGGNVQSFSTKTEWDSWKKD